MIVNGHQLPASLVRVLDSGWLRREVGSWPLKQNRDSFGNRLETELGEVFELVARISQETAALPAEFPPDQIPDTWPREVTGPGAIPDIRDFSLVVCFAVAGGGEPFCLDYREAPDRPAVIWWDDCYWRKVSPDFDAFLDLFDLSAAELDVAPDRRPST
jgi:hypothetical protein